MDKNNSVKNNLISKIRIIWDYYKVHIIGALILIPFLISIFYTDGRDTILFGVMVNGYNSNTEEACEAISDGFFEKYQYDPDSARIEFICDMTFVTGVDVFETDNYTTIEYLAAQSAADILDFTVGDYDSMSVLSYSEFFVDLSGVLSEDQMKIYEPYLMYIDLEVVEELRDIAATGNYDVEIEMPDFTKPEQMKKPVPVMINISRCKLLQEIYPNAEEGLAFAILVNAPHMDDTLNMLDYLWDS